MGALLGSPDGASWDSLHDSPGADLYGVWVSENLEVFAVGDGGIALYWSAAQDWIEMDTDVSVTLRGVFGFSADDVYAVGYDSTMLHFDGARWTAIDPPSGVDLFGITGTPNGDLFVVGGERLRSRLHEGSWEVQKENTIEDGYYGAWGSSHTDVFVVGLGGIVSHYDGSTWVRMENVARTPLFDVWGMSPSNVYAVGFDGTIIHYDGVRWKKVDSGLTPGWLSAIRSVWGRSATDVLAVGAYNLWGGESGANNGVALAFDGRGWKKVPSVTTLNGVDVFGNSKGAVFAVGDRGIVLRHDVRR